MRAQVALEFMVVAVLALVLVSFSLTQYFAKQSEFRTLSASSEAESICSRVAQSISSAYLSGDGFQTLVRLPPSFSDGTGYGISVFGSSSLAQVFYGDARSSCRFITMNISNGSSSEFNVSTAFNVSNQGGIVFVVNS